MMSRVLLSGPLGTPRAGQRKRSLDQGLSRYRRLVRAHWPVYRALEAAQAGIVRIPPRWTEAAFRLAGVPAFFSRLWATYAGAPSPRPVAVESPAHVAG